MEYPSKPEFKEYDGFKSDCIIVDIDGCLAFMGDKRTPYEYHKVEGDIANQFLILILPMFKNLAPCDIFIITGRDESCRRETEHWLRLKGVTYDFLLMRSKGDKRQDVDVKGEIYESFIKDNYNVLAVFEDRQRLVDMYRLKYNLPTYQVWYSPE